MTIETSSLKWLLYTVLTVFRHKFNLNIYFFCCEFYFCPICYLKWFISVFCFKCFTIYPCFYFFWMFILCRKEDTTFHIRSKKILFHINQKPSNKCSGLYKIFEEFNNYLYMWKCEVITIKKGKIFNISLNIAHFPIILSQHHTYLYNMLCKSHGFLISYFGSGNIFKKCDFLEKFVLSFFFQHAIIEHYYTLSKSQKVKLVTLASNTVKFIIFLIVINLIHFFPELSIEILS